jgi:hypothetical protein
MSANLKNFANGKEWWYMEKEQAVRLLDVITDVYNKKLSDELWYDDHDVSLKMYEIKDEIMRFPELIFKNAGIKVEKSKKWIK